MNPKNPTNPINPTNSINSNAHDPEAIPEAKRLMPDIEYYDDPYQAAEYADVVLILTDWNEYNQLNYKKIKEKMNTPNLIDGRNFLKSEKLKELGFNYLGIGRA